MTYRTVEISSYAEWLAEERSYAGKDSSAEQLASFDEDQQPEDQERTELLKKFPYPVMLKVAYPEMDFANRWCWQNIGPSDGVCDQSNPEYPGCPLVLATESIKKDEYLKDRKVYQKVEEHSHCGQWISCFLCKTEYNFGFNEWYFAVESDRDRFLAAVPTFNWGENFPRG